MKERTKVIVDDTTIYEVDLACYESLTPEEKRKYFPQTWEEDRRLHQSCLLYTSPSPRD